MVSTNHFRLLSEYYLPHNAIGHLQDLEPYNSPCFRGNLKLKETYRSMGRTLGDGDDSTVSTWNKLGRELIRLKNTENRAVFHLRRLGACLDALKILLRAIAPVILLQEHYHKLLGPLIILCSYPACSLESIVPSPFLRLQCSSCELLPFWASYRPWRMRPGARTVQDTIAVPRPPQHRFRPLRRPNRQQRRLSRRRPLHRRPPHRPAARLLQPRVRTPRLHPQPRPRPPAHPLLLFPRPRHHRPFLRLSHFPRLRRRLFLRRPPLSPSWTPQRRPRCAPTTRT